MTIDRVKRAFTWLRNTFRVIDKTTLPGEIAGTIGPIVDVFGWSRLELGGPQSLNSQGADNTAFVQLPVIPDGVQRLVLRASIETNDAASTMTLSLQVRSAGIDISVSPPGRVEAAVVPGSTPIRFGLERNLLLLPGERLIGVSNPAPAIGSALIIRYNFIDLDVGEYIPPIS